ncbi:hypothetical protein D9M71_691490 [compost metagenome]
MKIRVLDIRLPITGSRPRMKVSRISTLVSGSWMPISGSTTARKIPVSVVLTREILICAKTMLRKAVTSRARRSISRRLRGFRVSKLGMGCRAMMAPRIMPISMVTKVCAAPLPSSCSWPTWSRSQSIRSRRSSSALAGR